MPPAQCRMIVEDHRDQVDSNLRGEAVWEYIVNTLDPVVKNTLVGNDNYFYLLCLQGRYSQRQVHNYKQSIPELCLRPPRCHPQYLSNRAHRKLSQPGAFDGLRIHTDELQEVIRRIAPGTLSHAVVRPKKALQKQLTPSVNADPTNNRSWTAWTGSAPKTRKPSSK